MSADLFSNCYHINKLGQNDTHLDAKLYVSQKSQPFNKIKYQRLSNKSQSPDPIFKTMVC